MQWTADQKRTDLWRAGIGIVVIFLVLFAVFGLAGCTSTGPSLTLAASHRGDGFVRLHQALVEKDGHECFVEYEHHSEIFKEFNEDTYDGGLLGCTVQFGDWR